MLYVALDNIRSLLNVGAIFRTCSFFGVYNVILLGYTAKEIRTIGKSALHTKISKTSLHAEKDLNLTFISTHEELFSFAKQQGLRVVSVEQSSTAMSLQNTKGITNAIIVFGNEVTGVAPSILQGSAQVIEIQRYGKHNSLNVATSVGVVLYELTQPTS